MNLQLSLIELVVADSYAALLQSLIEESEQTLDLGSVELDDSHAVTRSRSAA